MTVATGIPTRHQPHAAAVGGQPCRLPPCPDRQRAAPAARLPAAPALPPVADLDAAAEPLLDAWRRGDLDVDRLRRGLAVLIDGSDVPAAVARRMCARSGRGDDLRLRADLTERLRILLIDKMLPPSTTFDPRRAGSVRGWAWKLASTAAVWQQRDLRRFYERFRLLANGEWVGLTGRPTGPGPRPTEPTTEPAATPAPSFDPERCADVADAVEALTRAARDDVHLQAEALLRGLGLPPVRRLTHLVDRERLHALLAADNGLAHRSLRHWARAGEPEPAQPPSPQPELDPALLGIWSRFSRGQAARLLASGGILDEPQAVAHTVALAAVAPLPRPSGKKIRAFVAAVSAASGERHPAVRDAAAAYVEAECEPVARRAGAVVDLASVLERHERLKRTFEECLAQVAELRSGLGDRPDGVRLELGRLAHREVLLFSSSLQLGSDPANTVDPGGCD